MGKCKKSLTLITKILYTSHISSVRHEVIQRVNPLGTLNHITYSQETLKASFKRYSHLPTPL